MRNKPHNFVPNIHSPGWDDICAVCGRFKRDDVHKQSKTWSPKRGKR